MRVELSHFDREYLEERARSSIVVDDKTAMMTKRDLAGLMTYSSTIPSGTFIGKRWKREIQDERRRTLRWMMGEYAPSPDPESIDIIWRDIVLVESEEDRKL